MERCAARGDRPRHAETQAISREGRRLVNERSERQRYIATYLSVLAPGPRAPGRSAAVPALDPERCYLPGGESAPSTLSLGELYRAGIECGHTEARTELVRRLQDVDEELGNFRAV